MRNPRGQGEGEDASLLPWRPTVSVAMTHPPHVAANSGDYGIEAQMSDPKDKTAERVPDNGEEKAQSPTGVGGDTPEIEATKPAKPVTDPQASPAAPPAGSIDDTDKADGLAAAREMMASFEKRQKEQLDAALSNIRSGAPNATIAYAMTLVTAFFSSGIFFLLLGSVFLFVAQFNMATNHAGITFVLVVLAVALLLYGTGTQGMGQFKSQDNAASYNVAIAGGAGVIAFIVAYGIIQYSTKMRNAFQPEKKFVRLLVQSDDGSTSLPLYVSSFEMDGISIPSARRGKLVEVYVPYIAYDPIRDMHGPEAKTVSPRPVDPGVCNSSENAEAQARLNSRAATKTISAMFYRVASGGHDDALKQSEPADFRIKLDQTVFDNTGGGSDYPVYPVRMCVNLQSLDKARDILANAGRQELRPAEGRVQPEPRPEALIEAR